jgi:signal transduction histidine kinase
MSQRVLWRTVAAIAAAHVGLVLLVWGVLSWPAAGSQPAPPTRRSEAPPGPLPPSVAVQRLAEALSNAAFQSVSTLDDAALTELVKRASAWPEVVYVSIEDGQGKIIAHTDPARIGQTWSPPAAREGSPGPGAYQEAIAPVLGSEESGKPAPWAGTLRLGFLAGPVTAPVPPSPARPVAPLRIAAALALAAIAAIPVGTGLAKLWGAAPVADGGVTDLRRIRSLRQARGVIAHWMRETDLVRAQLAGQREETQRLRFEVTKAASHLSQAAAESEQLLTERAHWLAERERLSAELTDRDRELEHTRLTLEDRASDAEGVRLLLESEVADLRDEVRHAHAALAGHPTVCRELLKRELRQHQHRAVAYISHAIRGSLTSVLGFSTLLLRDVDRPLTEDQRTSAQHIHEAGAHLLRVVTDLSDLTQVEAGTAELRDEIVDVTAVLREVAATGPAALARDAGAVTVVAPPDLPPVRGNSRRLVQLLLTLMQLPARHHDDGPVELSARADDESVTLIVTHHGIGLSAEDLPALFDPFSPIDATSTLQDDGRRLRLALARALATTIGGSIEVDGEASAGTTFTVRVPVAADVSAAT